MAKSEQSSVAPQQRRYLDVAQRLLAEIGAGVHAPGTKLASDRDLANSYGVARGTVREALLALELVGAIVIRQGDGVYVSQTGGVRIDQGDALLNGVPHDLIESRRLIEPLTTRLAVAAISEEQLDELDELLALAEGATSEPGQFKVAIEAGFEFHARMASFCGNQILADVVRQLVSVEKHPLWVLLNVHVLRPAGARQQQNTEHRAVLEALRARDAEKAEFFMRTHLSDLQTQVFSFVAPSNQ